jgi:hypothetical protein
MGCKGFKTKYHTDPISAIVFAMELSVGLLYISDIPSMYVFMGDFSTNFRQKQKIN